MDVKLKICGMKFPENIAAVAALQPDYLGFIFYPGSKRFVDALDPQVLANLKDIRKTGVFVNGSLKEIADMVALYNLQALQLHGQESPAFMAALRKQHPDLELIKAFGVAEDFDFAELTPYQGLADYFLFDTKTPEHGGSGQKFNWALLARYTLDTPYFLSGGIDIDTAEALIGIQDSRLHAVDVNSRFESAPGLKDIDKLIDFKEKIRL
jgi:phosphoribosylanthranilate isomerase